MTTRRDILGRISARLAPLYGAREARSIALVAVSELSGLSASALLTDPGAPLEIAELDDILGQLAAGRPVQYVVGRTEFCGRTFAVREGVLIPRPETEELAAWIAQAETEAAALLDVGTGSGCIAATLALALPGAQVYAADISDTALETAARNCRALGAGVILRKADALSDLADVFPGPFDVIVSNPPYVPQSDLPAMHVNVREYRAARSAAGPRRRPAALLPRHRPRRTADAPPRRQALLRNLRTLRRGHAPHARRRGIYGHRGPRRPQRQTPHDMQPPEVKKTGKRAKTPEQALAALMRLCARAEKSQDDARRLMRGWGLAEREGEQVLARLVRDRFIDDGRYAEAFVRDKLRLSGWGEYKIRTALQRKRIDRELIDAALAQADRQDMAGRLRQQLERKMRTTRHTTQYELKTKLIRYGLSLGYDYETVLDSAAALVTDTETCDEF